MAVNVAGPLDVVFDFGKQQSPRSLKRGKSVIVGPVPLGIIVRSKQKMVRKAPRLMAFGLLEKWGYDIRNRGLRPKVVKAGPVCRANTCNIAPRPRALMRR